LFSDQDLVQLLQKSCEKNARLGLTGMLLYKDGNFMQVLEGPEKTVGEVYATILNDSRHHGAILLLKERIEDRKFSNWSMGFRNLRDVDLKEVPGYTDFLGESLISPSFRSTPTRAQKLLLMFREKM
jgi:hypothetical protein